MNGLFFGNTASGGGVDPRYPVIIMPNPTFIKYNACTYINLSEIATDDTTSYKKLDFQFECDSEDVVIDVIRSRKYQMRTYTDNPDLDETILHVTVTDLDGFTTKKDITLKVDKTL